MTYIEVPETARKVRAALRTAFPKAKFSVTSGGDGINVTWEDTGPTLDAVKAALIAAGADDIKRGYGSDYMAFDGHSFWFDRFNVAEREAFQSDLERGREEWKARQERERAEIAARPPPPGGTYKWGGKLERVGILKDGSLYNPNGYPEGDVRAAVLAADVRVHEKRSEAAKEAGKTRTKRQELRIGQVAQRLLRNEGIGARSSCYICRKKLSDAESIERGIGPECWQHILAGLTRLQAAREPAPNAGAPC